MDEQLLEFAACLLFIFELLDTRLWEQAKLGLEL